MNNIDGVVTDLPKQVYVLIHRRPTQPTNPRQLAHIHFPFNKSGIMLVKHCRNAFSCALRPANLLSFCLCILHPAAYPRPDHRKLQLSKHTAHLNKRLTHRINLTFAAIDCDAAHNDQSQMLFLHRLQYFAKLLRATAETAHFERDDRVALSRGIQEHMEVLFDLGVAVLIFEDHFVRACGFQLADLAVDVLLVVCCAATCISVYFELNNVLLEKEILANRERQLSLSTLNTPETYKPYEQSIH